MKEKIIESLLNRGYILKNGEEIDAIVEYIEMSQDSGNYSIEQWVEDTINNYPETLVRL